MNIKDIKDNAYRMYETKGLLEELYEDYEKSQDGLTEKEQEVKETYLQWCDEIIEELQRGRSFKADVIMRLRKVNRMLTEIPEYKQVVSLVSYEIWHLTKELTAEYEKQTTK